jgi:ankyrin repeat protein
MAPIDDADDDGRTPLRTAALHSREGVLRLLVAFGEQK